MTDRVYLLPDEFFGSLESDQHILFYQTSSSSEKNKVNLKQHLVCFVIEGQKEINTYKDSYQCNPDQFLLLSAGNTLMSERTALKGHYSSILLFFSDIFLAEFLPAHLFIHNTDREYPDCLLFKRDGFINHFLESLQLLNEEGVFTPGIIKAKLSEIFQYLYKKFPGEIEEFIVKAMGKKGDMQFKETIQNIENDELSNAELAFLCNMSISSFMRKFSSVYKMTPRQYFIRKRMNKAIVLLRQQRRPSEIYDELGYENAASFSKEFKKYFNVSPGSYKFKN